MIFAIDPGNKESGYVFTKDNLEIIEKGKIENELLLEKLEHFDICYYNHSKDLHVAIEMIASYGMPVGVEVFETCVWIGRFKQYLINKGVKEEDIKYIYRKDEKMTICHSMKANDTTIKQALVDRFAPGQKNYGKGTKKNPGWFYGFKADIWAAYAVATTYHDLYMEGENK